MTQSLNDFRIKVGQLFFICNQLRESIGRVSTTINEIYEVSLRSGISSSHVEVGKRAFNEIAKQIASTSKAMEEESKQIRDIGTLISNLSLACLRRALQIKKMEEARKMGCGRNEKAVEKAIERMEKAIFKQIDEIELLCRRTNVLSTKIAQQAERLWSLAVNLRMEASQSGEEEELFFSNIGAAVAAAGEKLKVQQEAYQGLIRQCREIRGELKSFQGDYKHAA